MQIVDGKALCDALRLAVDRAHERLWVSSPYIGGWPGNVRRILGTRWQQNVKDVRLLTDVAARGFNITTMKQFARRGPVRTLKGLHAKLYVVDDFVLLTSANLTGTAFSKRYEVGIVLRGKRANDAADVFKAWWLIAHAVSEDELADTASHANNPDDQGGSSLPTLNRLPPDVKDAPLPSDTFGDYNVFLTCFDELARTYTSVQRLWKRTPINFEIDAFLNYLYHHAPGRPSRRYDKMQPRKLTSAQRQQQTRKFASLFASEWSRNDINESPGWRIESAKIVRELLRRNLRRGLARSDIKELLQRLNSMKSYPVNIARILNPENNSLGEIRAMLRYLVDESTPLQRRMAECSQRLFGLSTSSVQELVGFYYAGKYPLRNKNTNCGLRFFGYNVRAR